MKARHERGRRLMAAGLTLVKAKGEMQMSNQNFKMILTGPISSMGDVVNCVTGHGGKIEMVEIEELATVPAVEEARGVLDDARERAKLASVTALEVYQTLRDGNLTDTSSKGVARVIEAKRGAVINKNSVVASLSKMMQLGIVENATPERRARRHYRVIRRIADGEFTTMMSDYHRSLQGGRS